MDLQNGLTGLGINRILVADDTAENLDAARSLAELLPGIVFEFFTSGASVIEEIQRDPGSVGLVITDRQMETENAGIDVAAFGWGMMVPVIVASGGYQHAGSTQVRIAPVGAAIDGSKNSPAVWEEILKEFLANVESRKSLLHTMLLARRAGVDPESQADGFLSSTIRGVMLGYLQQEGEPDP
ncbi:MAG: hypothetical protein WCV68_01680 [Candidatus Paceibacterota bacterium]|jgi:hypothetical protein